LAPGPGPRAGNIHREHFEVLTSVHESDVFNGPRRYRVVLPDDYATSGRRYPVVFLLHGWGGCNATTYRIDWLENDFPRRNEAIFVFLDGVKKGTSLRGNKPGLTG